MPLWDTQYSEVWARRYRCVNCGRTFRLYPAGVCREHFSQRVKGLAPVGAELRGRLFAAGSAGGFYEQDGGYYTVQRTARNVPGMKREEVFERVRTPALWSAVTPVKVKGKWYPIGVVVDAGGGIGLSVEGLQGEDAETLKGWLQPVVEAVGAELLVTDDADAFKKENENLREIYPPLPASRSLNNHAWRPTWPTNRWSGGLFQPA